MTLFKDLFLPKETKQCLFILEEYEDEFNELSEKSFNPLWYGAVLEVLIKDTEKVLRKGSKEIVKAVNLGNGTPRLITIRTIHNISKDRVLSGYNHLYRGVLSDSGAAYYLILKKTIKILHKLGELSKEDVKLIKKEIKNGIDYAG